MSKKMKFKNFIRLACFLKTVMIDFAYGSTSEPGYGNEWLLYYDDEGNTHTMNFSTIPNDTRTIIYAETEFYLYTRQNNELEEIYAPASDEVFSSEYFNSSNLIVAVTHGWLGSTQSEWLQSIKDELLINGDFNVIAVDWSEMAKNKIYPWVAFSTRFVGKKIAKLLDAIATEYEIDGSVMHLMGHSLGAHVMAYAAMFSNQRIQRITGLDPARPLFEAPMMPKNCRLDKSDAEFVDILHTSTGLYGYKDSHGDADFYPNGGGSDQPGCNDSLREACGHGRACLYFNESINAKTLFNAYPCENWDKFERGECRENFSYMGYQAANELLTGEFYLYTNENPPFARGEE